MNPSVVDGEEHHGVVAQPPLVEAIEHGTDGFVEPFAHGVISGELGMAVGPLVFLQQAGGGIVRFVRQHGGIPQEERLGPGLIEEPIDGGEGVAANFQPIVAMPSLGGHAMGEAGVGEVPLPILAGLEAEVPALGEKSRERGGALDERVHGGAVDPFGRVVAADAVLVPVLAGQQGGQAGPAQRGGNIAIRELHTLGGQPIDAGGADVGMSHEAKVGPSLVIRDDQQQVGRTRRREGLVGGDQRPRSREGDRHAQPERRHQVRPPSQRQPGGDWRSAGRGPEQASEHGVWAGQGLEPGRGESRAWLESTGKPIGQPCVGPAESRADNPKAAWGSNQAVSRLAGGCGMVPRVPGSRN